MTDPVAMDSVERERSLEGLRLERDSAFLYERLARGEGDPERARAFRAIAEDEQRHAAFWAGRLTAAGIDVPPPARPRWRVRAVLLIARFLGSAAVSDLVKRLERDEEALYATQGGSEVAAIVADEREHLAIWKRLDAGLPGIAPDAVTEEADKAVGDHEHGGRGWHITAQSGALRASVFGINDGLVSNLALVMGFAGAATQNEIVVLAGVAGLLAGAFSMAAGEYVSVQSQVELLERQIEVEREELRMMPEVTRHELVQIYRDKGLSEDEADLVVERLMQEPATALDTKIREELGLDPDELGSPWVAAGSSFVAFSVGAFVPLAPFLLAAGTPAIVSSVTLSLVVLFIVGALVSLLTGRSLLFSGGRQMAIGGGAALVTFIVGSFIGVSVA